MQSLRRAAAAAFAAAVVITAMVLPGSPAQADTSAAGATKVSTSSFAPGATIHGCRSGNVCIYPGEGWNNDRPELQFGARGVHELYGQYGWKWIFSNQTDNWIARVCYERGGNDCRFTIYQGQLWDVWMDPVDSIVLTP